MRAIRLQRVVGQGRFERRELFGTGCLLVGAARFPFCIAFNRLPEREQLGSSDRLPGTVRTRSRRPSALQYLG